MPNRVVWKGESISRWDPFALTCSRDVPCSYFYGTSILQVICRKQNFLFYVVNIFKGASFQENPCTGL